MKHVIRLGFIILLAFTQTLSSQVFIGTVQNKFTNQPISDVTILLSDNYTVVTNQNGQFELNQKILKDFKLIKFTAIGYQELVISTQSL